MNALASAARQATIVALPSDFDRWRDLLDLILRSFATMDGVIDPPSSAHRLTPDSLRDKACNETVFLAIDGSRIVGCVFAAIRETDIYLGKLAVAPERQGEGIGRRLLAQVEELARARGKQALELQTRVELVGNHAAFCRMGFRETGRTAHPGFSRPTSITMHKDVLR